MLVPGQQQQEMIQVAAQQTVTKGNHLLCLDELERTKAEELRVMEEEKKRKKREGRLK